jgi:DNA invertase Pin-like site-specific DNA recombinase
MLAMLTDGKVNVVIVEKLDRLARDLMVSETIIGEFQKQRVELVSVAEPDLCSNDPSRKLVRQIFGAIAAYEKEMIVLKTRAARERIRAAGNRCEGAKPFGHKHAHEKDALRQMAALRQSGLAVDVIAAQMNQSGIRTRHGKKWHGMTVAKILKREGDGGG